MNAAPQCSALTVGTDSRPVPDGLRGLDSSERGSRSEMLFGPATIQCFITIQQDFEISSSMNLSMKDNYSNYAETDSLLTEGPVCFVGHVEDQISVLRSQFCFSETTQLLKLFKMLNDQLLYIQLCRLIYSILLFDKMFYNSNNDNLSLQSEFNHNHH